MITQPPFALSGGNPFGGTYSGTGVNNGVFSPAVAGVGTHAITYTINNCNPASATSTITVVPNATNAIVVDNISKSKFCIVPGDITSRQFALNYTAIGSFNSGNIFTAQLSNASGSFSSPTNIGSISKTTSGSISCLLPANIAAGSNYKVRVISTNPVVTSNIFSSPITVEISPCSVNPDKADDTDNVTNIDNMEFNKDDFIQIYPVPAKDKLFIRNNTRSNIILYFYNVNGNIIDIKEMKNDNDKIDISGFSTGLYFCKIYYNDKAFFYKIPIIK